jgi:hypothetical protein
MDTLIDRLGERLGCERIAAALYRALIARLEVSSEAPAGGPSAAQLMPLLDDELRHIRLLEEAMARRGADPTLLTPAAQAQSVALRGLVELTQDPESARSHWLGALRDAELIDHDGWELLAEVCADQPDAIDPGLLERVLTDEAAHLAQARRWLAEEVLGHAPRPRRKARVGGGGRRRGKPSPSESAIAFIEEQQRRVDLLLRKLGREATLSGRRLVLAHLTGALARLGDLATRLFYPAVRDRTTEDVIGDAAEHHRAFADAVAELAAIGPTGAGWDERLARLTADVERHFADEQQRLFPRVEELFDAAELAELARTFAAASGRAPGPHPEGAGEPADLAPSSG